MKRLPGLFFLGVEQFDGTALIESDLDVHAELAAGFDRWEDLCDSGRRQ
jgi:hypothetical protein